MTIVLMTHMLAIATIFNKVDNDVDGDGAAAV